jgi:hypothetical protein
LLPPVVVVPEVAFGLPPELLFEEELWLLPPQEVIRRERESAPRTVRYFFRPHITAPFLFR